MLPGPPRWVPSDPPPRSWVRSQTTSRARARCASRTCHVTLSLQSLLATLILKRRGKEGRNLALEAPGGLVEDPVRGVIRSASFGPGRRTSAVL